MPRCVKQWRRRPPHPETLSPKLYLACLAKNVSFISTVPFTALFFVSRWAKWPPETEDIILIHLWRLQHKLYVSAYPSFRLEHARERTN